MSLRWRYSNYDTPFWARNNTRDGRWNTAGEAAVQYLAMEPNGAWAELIRAEALRWKMKSRLFGSRSGLRPSTRS